MALVGSLAVSVGLLLLPSLAVWARHLLVTHFGVETKATVTYAQQYEQDDDYFLQGCYVYRDVRGRDHTFHFLICMHWPGNDQWWQVMQCYRQGTQKRVRYIPWLPILHEMQDSL